jgi:hypothetical protein
LGLGYFVQVGEMDNSSFSVGLEGYYLSKTSVGGNILVEQQFENLGYGYEARHIPVLLSAKANISKPSSKYGLILSGGIGPNFVETSNYKEHSLDGGITIPRDSFVGKSSIKLSASMGVGIELKEAIGKRPIDCGYRFFYLGRTGLNRNNALINNNLSTGSNYAHAFICSAKV